jgi:biotin transport system substrate-specific component
LLLLFILKNSKIKTFNLYGGKCVPNSKAKRKIYDIVYIALFTSVISVCAWITVPFVVPFTMQTFAVFVTLALLGGKRGTITGVCYITLGMLGLPVFSGFNGGISALFGATGGYIIGFLGASLLMWGFEKLFGNRRFALLISMALGLIVCYLFGSVWYMLIYMNEAGISEFFAALLVCVIPYIIPDIVKILLVLLVKKRLGKYIK